MRTTIDPFNALSDEERSLLSEALSKLREIKVEALTEANKPPLRPARAFEERDFGIPAIDRLMERLNPPEELDEPRPGSARA